MRQNKRALRQQRRRDGSIVQADKEGFLQLTYCTNIHPADGWDAVFENLKRYAPELRRQFSPDAPFGIGLRLSARDASELLGPGKLDEFRTFLDSNGLYVALINGFPYGSFHGTVVKENVFAPDWREEARVAYTLQLVEILSKLLPDGLDGGISTIPLSYKAWMRDSTIRDWEAIVRNLTRVVEVLVRIGKQSGKLIHIDIEPEPDGLVENSEELIAFYEKWLLSSGSPLLAAALDVEVTQARQLILDHVQVCFDSCHFAVEYEDLDTALQRFKNAGIKIGRVQLSSALKVEFPDDPTQRSAMKDRLEHFAESTYLHQVIAQCGCSLKRFPDLDKALVQPSNGTPEQWRIHFHVPLFTENYAELGSTQGDVRAALGAAVKSRFTRHLEIETYTWDVLPPSLKLDLQESISREFRWVLDELQSIGG